MLPLFAPRACAALAVACSALMTFAACSKGDKQPPVVTYAAPVAEPASPPAPAVEAPSVAASAAPADLAPPTSGPRVVKEFAAVDAVSLGSVPPGIAMPPGAPAPSATLLDGEGKRVDLAALRRENGALLLVFSRGGFDPYGNFEIRELARANAAFRKRGIVPVVITVDRPAEALKTKTTYDVPFPVLSDQDLTLHEAYRVVHRADEKELKSPSLATVDLGALSARSHHGFAVPSLFLVSKEGKVLWSHATEDERTRPKVSQILAALDAKNLPPRAH